MSKADEMFDFKKGEKIVAKQDIGGEVKKGQIYTVKEVDGDFVHCKELEYGYFYFYFKKSADEILKNLGYKKYESEICVQYIREGLDRIELYKKIKEIRAYLWNDGAKPLVKSISSIELQAINEKVKELRME